MLLDPVSHSRTSPLRPWQMPSHPTNDPLLETTRVQSRVAPWACKEMQRWQTAMDNSRSSEWSGGWTSGTSMERRIRCNSALMNCPSLSLLHGNTNDTPWTINIRQLGVYHTRGNNNTSRQTKTTGNVEDVNSTDSINWQRDHGKQCKQCKQCKEVWEELYHEGTLFEIVHQQWYTEKRANKLEYRIPAPCRCCDNREYVNKC